MTLAEGGKWFGGGPTRAGISVGPDTAMRCGAFYACVRILAEDVGALPIGVHQRLPDGGRRKATEHPLHRVLRRQANAWQTAMEYREMMQAHVEMRGNAYSYITRGVGGRVLELLPIHPDSVTVHQAKDYTVTYKVRGEEAPSGSIFHLRGLTLDGVTGVSPITYMRESIGLALAAEKHGALLFGNGARPGMVAEAPAEFSAGAVERLKESIERGTSGDNLFRLLVLEEGAKLSAAPVSMTNEDAQFLDLRKYQRSEIAGMCRVPPHMIGDLERATFSNIEEQGQHYLDGGLNQRLVRFEQRANMTLLTPAEQETHYVEFNRLAFNRGNSTARAAFYGSAIRDGWMNRNEPRERENMPPGPPELNEFLRPLNMARANERTPDA
ncbi:phage portal protein [Longimicrobium sp.]|uniref:phage portal protein n=1 Tax=Longimicrobium sp. TaxID=2029185 RepID=UPI002F931896